MDKINKLDRCTSLFTVCLLIFPFANVYLITSMGLGVGEILMALCIIGVIFLSGFKISVGINNNFIVFFIVYSLIISLVTIFLYPTIETSETMKRIIRDGYYILIIFGFSRYYFDNERAFRILNYLSIILSIYIIVQFTAYIVFKVYVPGFLSGFSIDAGTAELYKQKALRDAAILGYLRPNGFLSEPAQCAHFLSLTILLNLFWGRKTDKSRTRRIVLFTAALVCSTSLNGMVLLVTVYGIYFLHSFKSIEKERILTTLVSIIVFIISIVVAYIKVPYIQNIMARLGNISSTTTGSAAMRTMRGIVFFEKMPFLDKLFGIGFGNFIGYREATGIWTAYEEAVEYFNTNSYLLVSAGILGCLLLVLAIFRYIQLGDSITVAIFVLLFVIGISSSIYSTPFLAIAISFAIVRNNDKDYNYDERFR